MRTSNLGAYFAIGMNNLEALWVWQSAWQVCNLVLLDIQVNRRNS